MTFYVKQKSSVDKSWTQLLVEKSEHSYKADGTRRVRTFRRMYMSVFVLFSAAFLIFCSLFYVGAFYDVGDIVGVSYSKRASAAKSKIQSTDPGTERTVLSPFIDAFALNRVYLRKNQTIVATYSTPRGAQINLTIKQCKHVPVIEIFSCKFIGEQKTVLNNARQGHATFTVTEPGFYYFKATALKIPDTTLHLNHDFKVIWQRG